ncbi:MAG TPA: LemA family protein [Firmicutes bacterium]|nr:LemA family protein [Bacillota bacterium]
MKRSTQILLAVVIVLIILVGSVVGKYNQLVELETSVDGRWAQVENQLQRRADLVPNLVNTVKGYASHEEGVFTEIAQARARLLAARTPADQMEANAGLDSALGRLLAISEAYPDLKADTSFVRLQDELAGTENRIATERMRFNESVQNWNATIRKFPTNILANVLGKQAKLFFEVAEGAREVPQVQF